MELQLGNIDRCRTLYQKYIEWSPANAAAWGRCADAWLLWEFGCGVGGVGGVGGAGLYEHASVSAATPARQGHGGRQGRGPMHAAAPPTHLTDPHTRPSHPHLPTLKCRFADLERSLGESERARAVYELAIAQPVLDMPEVLWKVRQGGAAKAGSMLQRQRTHAVGRGLRHSHAAPLCLASACAYRARSAWRWSSCTGLLAVLSPPEAPASQASIKLGTRLWGPTAACLRTCRFELLASPHAAGLHRL